ncbi:unnamed protein product [Anisakis simplex]|uniref:Uncharacterized protein n=1 Tax=Anisakis simplex TaxID=6269 RepID=A0A0M3JVE7_ANISI|nr:unnamed protein product [Anisakis simplex]
MLSFRDLLGNDSDLEIDEAEANQNDPAEDETVIKQKNQISVASSEVSQLVQLSSSHIFEMVSGMISSLEKSGEGDLAKALDTISISVSTALKKLNEAVIRKESVCINRFILNTGKVFCHDDVKYQCFSRCMNVIKQLMEDVKRLVSGSDNTISANGIRKLPSEQIKKMKKRNRLRRLESKYRAKAKKTESRVNGSEKSVWNQWEENVEKKESESKIWKRGKDLSENVPSTSNFISEQCSRITTQTTESVRRSTSFAKSREKELNEEEDRKNLFSDNAELNSGETSNAGGVAREQSMDAQNNARNCTDTPHASGPSFDSNTMNTVIDQQPSFIQLQNPSSADTSVSSTFSKLRNDLLENLPAHSRSPFKPPSMPEELNGEGNKQRICMAIKKTKAAKLKTIGTPAEQLMDIDSNEDDGLVDELVSGSSSCAAESVPVSSRNQCMNTVMEQQSFATNVGLTMTTDLSQSKDHSQQSQPSQLQKRSVPASLRYRNKSFLKVRKIDQSTNSGNRSSKQNSQKSSLKTSNLANTKQKHVSFHPNEVSSICNGDGSTGSISSSVIASKMTKSLPKRHPVDEFRASCRRISGYQGTVLKNWLVVDSSFDQLDETLFSEIRPNNFPHTVITSAYFPQLSFKNFEKLMGETFEVFPRVGSVNIFFAVSHDVALLRSSDHNPAQVFIQFITRFAMRSMSIYRKWWDSSYEKYEASSERYQEASETLKTDYISFLEPPTIVLINAPQDNNEENEKMLRVFNVALKRFVQEEAKKDETSSRFYDEAVKRKLRIELIDWREICNGVRAVASGQKITALLRYLHIVWGVIPHEIKRC